MSAASTLELSRTDRLWAQAFGVAGGVAAGVVLQFAWPHVRDTDWLPWRDILRVLMSTDLPASTILRPVALGLVGLAAMTGWAMVQPRLRVTDDEIVVRRRGQTDVIRREQVDGIRLRGRRIVIASPRGRILFDAEIEGAKNRAEGVFRSHGYPWESR